VAETLFNSPSLRHEAVDDKGRENLDGFFRNEAPEKGRDRSCDNIANPPVPRREGYFEGGRVMENGLSEVRVLSIDWERLRYDT